MKEVILMLILSLILSLFDTQAQDRAKKDLFYKLDKEETNYDKSVYTRTVTIKTKREYTGYSFFFLYSPHPAGYLSFSGHDNPEVGEVFGPIRVISDSAYKKLEFISFDKLVKLLKQHDLRFNDIYNLYFVEPNEKEKGKYTVYNVKFRNSFIPED